MANKNLNLPPAMFSSGQPGLTAQARQKLPAMPAQRGRGGPPPKGPLARLAVVLAKNPKP